LILKTKVGMNVHRMGSSLHAVYLCSATAPVSGNWRAGVGRAVVC
jgi:hypothetical protein